MRSLSSRAPSDEGRFRQSLEEDSPADGDDNAVSEAGPSRPLGFAPPKPAPVKKALSSSATPSLHDDEEHEHERDMLDGDEDEDGNEPPDDSADEDFRPDADTQAKGGSRARHAARRRDSQTLQTVTAATGAEDVEDAPEDDVSMDEDNNGGADDDDEDELDEDAYAEQSTYGTDAQLASAAYSSRNATAERPFGCSSEGCTKNFSRRSDLLRHFRIHTKEKPYQCKVCDKRFIQRSALTVHSRTHTGERPHSCEICKRKFGDSSSLARHRRVHTGARPYACEHCSKRYCRKTTLDRHYLKTHHPQRFALEYEALKTKQAVSNERRRKKLVQAGAPKKSILGAERGDALPQVPATEQYRLPPAASHSDEVQRVPSTSRHSDAHYATEAPVQYHRTIDAPEPLSASSYASTSQVAYAPRYALDSYGQTYEIDEYGNSVGGEIVQYGLPPPSNARSAPPRSFSPPAGYPVNGSTPAYPPPRHYLHNDNHVAPPGHHSFDRERARLTEDYVARHAHRSRDPGAVWNHNRTNSVSSFTPHPHSVVATDRGSLHSSNVEWQPAAPSHWPLTPASSSFYRLHRSPQLAEPEPPVHSSLAAAADQRRRDSAASSAGMSATLSHAPGPEHSSPILPLARTLASRATESSPPEEGAGWFRSPQPPYHASPPTVSTTVLSAPLARYASPSAAERPVMSYDYSDTRTLPVPHAGSFLDSPSRMFAAPSGRTVFASPTQRRFHVMAQSRWGGGAGLDHRREDEIVQGSDVPAYESPPPLA
ncbi:hypothetical protein JCM10908_000820 [Rhodotorula pacifica]|uniref:uncharacterized protein n=1 Tax=Rhodotorula pacifica TaxID=1495444 RepID=UPI00316E05D1